ncbi:uncharacterized protein [Triticum aestivum]|uniref:uncharacterized protein n=1 Tax=Triticum aestivum TaxID=4565 RepID=UPI001D032CC3|nr:uncharacterized protein LOC123142261 [Triticum aestivum]
MDDDQARELRALERILSDPSVEPTMLSYGILKYITNSFSNEIGRGGFGVVYQIYKRKLGHTMEYLCWQGIIRGCFVSSMFLKEIFDSIFNKMEPKITDFGLSRFLDQGTSTLLTSRIAGTLRYIAPESKDNGEVSLKSDIYALGVIMVELLSGMSMISLLHWDKYIDMSLPRVRGCTELARNCMDQDKHQRPTVREVIRDLDSLESMFPWSSISQSRPMGPESTVVKLPSRSLTIAWVDNPEYWRWTSRRDSRFTRPSLKETFHVFLTRHIFNLMRAISFLVHATKVSRLITPKDLPAATTSYTAYLVYKRAGSTLEGIVQTASTLHFDNIIASSKVSLHPKEGGPSSAHGVTYPVTRGDGWLELRLGEFSNEKAVTVQLLHEDPNKEMSGLIIDGMEVRRSL